MNWHPLSESPRPLCRPHSAMILCVDDESQWLMPGPVSWCVHRERWIDDNTDEVIDFRAADTDYFWCLEEDLVKAAMDQLAVRVN